MSRMESFGDVFENVLKYLNKLDSVSEVGYKTWLATLEPYKLENNTAYLLTESEFTKKTTLDIYAPVIKEAFESVLGFPVDLKLLVKSKDVPSEEEETVFVSRPAYGGSDSENEGSAQKKARYTFDNFIKGKSSFSGTHHTATFPQVPLACAETERFSTLSAGCL